MVQCSHCACATLLDCRSLTCAKWFARLNSGGRRVDAPFLLPDSSPIRFNCLQWLGRGFGAFYICLARFPRSPPVIYIYIYMYILYVYTIYIYIVSSALPPLPLFARPMVFHYSLCCGFDVSSTTAENHATTLSQNEIYSKKKHQKHIYMQKTVSSRGHFVLSLSLCLCPLNGACAPRTPRVENNLAMTFGTLDAFGLPQPPLGVGPHRFWVCERKLRSSAAAVFAWEASTSLQPQQLA